MRYRTLLCLTPALILSSTACGSEPASGPDRGPSATTSVAPTSPPPAPASSLTVEVRASREAPARTVRLTCDPPGGTAREAAKACAAVKAVPNAFAKPPADQMCTKIYGGPEVATVRGTWQGTKVEATFGRADGCQLARWEKLAPLFGSVPKVR